MLKKLRLRSREEIMRIMTQRFTKWLFVCMLLQTLTACSYFQFYADRYMPYAGHTAYLRRLQWLRENDVKVVQVGDQLRMIIPTDKFFEPDSDEILVTKDCVLAEIAGILRACGNVPILISGHTDDIGEFQRKQRKSTLHAQSIASFLWLHGVRWHNMTVHAFANDVTTASDSTIEGSMYNRRVEVEIN